MKLLLLLFYLPLISCFKVVIVGSGPVGKLASISLAKKGFEVSIFEKSSEPPEEKRSFNFILSKRGIGVLNKYDIDLKDGVNVKNIVSHSPYMKFKSPESISIDRNDLLFSLNKKVKELNIDTKISKFKMSDFNKKIAYFSHGNEKYDLLIGADGSNSEVRRQLSSFYPNEMKISEEKDTKLYKTIKLDSSSIRNMEGYDYDWDDSFHTWKNKNNDIICPPTKEKGLSGVFVSSNGIFNLDEFHLIYPFMRSEDIDNFESQDYMIQKTVISSCIGLHSTLLLGDSCHTMLASLGQGINSGLEDVIIMENCIKYGINKISENYNRLRLDDAKAVCNLSKNAFGGKSDRTNRGNSSNVLKYIGDPCISYSEIYKMCN